MTTTYSWIFPTLDAYPEQAGLTKPVHTVHWRLMANDGEGHMADAYGTQACGPVDAENYTAFESLTKAQVQAWVESAMGEEAVAAIKASLDAQIALQIAPTSLPLIPPWTTEE